MCMMKKHPNKSHEQKARDEAIRQRTFLSHPVNNEQAAGKKHTSLNHTGTRTVIDLVFKYNLYQLDSKH